MLKKKLIVVANKENIKDISAEVDKFDYVIRFNRGQTFCGKSGYKCDLFLCNCCGEWKHLVTQQQIDNVKKYAKYLLIEQRFYSEAKKVFNEHIKQKNFALISLQKFAKETYLCKNFIIDDPFKQMRPTGFFLMLAYAIEHFSQDYDIWITGADIADRQTYLLKAVGFQNTHVKAFKLEEKIISQLIENEKIHMLKCQV